MKRGKYERVEAKPQKKAVSGLLQTYIISILSLVLCCAMFLSTTFAWFTSDVTSAGNQIYIGKLEAGLYHEGMKINDHSDHAVFDNNIKWTPGGTTEETLTIRNEGDLAFNYYLQFLVTANTVGTETELTAEEVTKIAQCFEVSYLDTSAVVNGEEVWSKVTNSEGETVTLAEILEEHIPVFKGEMPAGNGTAKNYKVKLTFKEASTDESIMGKMLRIDVCLVASQVIQSDLQEQETPVADAGEVQ